MEAKLIGFTFFGNNKYRDITFVKNSSKDLVLKCQIELVSKFKSNDIFISGDEHQYAKWGVPVFEDTNGNRYKYELNLRNWSKILALAFGGNYLDCYCRSKKKNHKTSEQSGFKIF